MTSRAYKIEITTEPLGILSAESSGLSQLVQAVRAIVTYAGEARSHVLISPASASDDDALQPLFPNDVVSAARSETEGAATISCQAKSERERSEAAAVVATIKRS